MECFLDSTNAALATNKLIRLVISLKHPMLRDIKEASYFKALYNIKMHPLIRYPFPACAFSNRMM